MPTLYHTGWGTSSLNSGVDNAIKNVELVIDKKPRCICGIGMGGDEVKYPHRLFRDAFMLAREHGIPSTLHVSEFTHGETTIEAIEELRPNRLGHALNTVKSPDAYRAMKKSGIHVESCPLCNYVALMGGINDIVEHPIRRYYTDGIPVSINTDDPQIFGYDLIDNYVCLMKEANFSFDDFRAIDESIYKFTFIKRQYWHLDK